MQLQAQKDLPFFFFFVNSELNNFWGIGSVRQLRGHVGRYGSAMINNELNNFWGIGSVRQLRGHVGRCGSAIINNELNNFWGIGSLRHLREGVEVPVRMADFRM